MSALLFGVAFHCKRSSYQDLVYLKPNYDTRFLHHYHGRITEDRLNNATKKTAFGP